MANSPYGMHFQPLDANGNPYPLATMHCLSAGTAWPAGALVVYSDYNLATPAANPVVADANGVFPVRYLANATAYKFIISKADATVLWTDDNVYGGQSEYISTVAATSASATTAVKGTNSSTGIAGEFIASGTGYGVKSTGNGTKPPLFLTPQDAPTSLLAGGAWPDSITKLLSVANGVIEARLVHQIHQIVGSETRAIGAAFSTSKATVPANTLRQGQRIKVQASLNVTVAADGVGTCDFTIFFGAIGGAQISVNSSAGGLIVGSVVFVDAEFVIDSLGAGGTALVRGSVEATSGHLNANKYLLVGTTSINTTIANDIYVIADNAGGGMSFSAVLTHFSIESSS